ncbi:MAG: hypothetical protein K8L97_22175 [Anaerolineae bacterium]|nr:hypothetical protein [Anaerolineae bacterium]
MGYDCYITLQTSTPDAAVGHAILDLLEVDEEWGVFPVSEVGDDYLYCQWEGRNRDEDMVRALLEPTALHHAITFEVSYSSDYDTGMRFFVGTDAERLNTVHSLDGMVAAFHDLLAQPPATLRILLQHPLRRAEFETLIDQLREWLTTTGGTSS